MRCRRGHSPGRRQRTMSLPRVLVLCFLTAAALGYKQGDNVTVYVNKVGPYHNPQETYHFYTLPVCRPDKVHHKSLSLGEVLDGDRMAESLYHIRFRENVEKKTLCQLTLSEKQVDQLREAIEELYYFEFVLDDIPIWGFVGYIEESGFLPHSHKVGLWTHLDFNIEYNGDSVIFANVSVKEVKPVPLEDGAGAALGGVGVGGGSLTVIHTYSVRWFESPLTHARRAERLRDYSFFPKTLEIHWLSIINSLVLVVLLLGFVIIILMRVLKNDFARYNVEEEAGCDDPDQGDIGWKIIHTDVFRFPPYKSLLCAVLGVGAQFLTLATGIIVMALLGMFNVHRHGAINSAAIVLYALTSCVSGYISCSFYTQINGRRWVWNIILTSSLFSAPLFLTWSVVNSVHWWSGSTQALPATTVLLLLGAWVSVGFPLTVIGGIVGKNRAGGFQAPCRTRNIPRQIPPQPWYKHAAVHMAIGGFLPFSAISVELYYIFATVWGREHYTLYGILLCVFAILLSVGACISVALTYFLLSGEDYRWWWRSVLSTGSTGLFIFVYSVFYYRNRSSMSGLVQSTEFFGYSLLTALVFSLMLGSVSFWASLAFIRYIYRSLKMD
ncbi:transmembrane 9 superfamily member 1 [Phyllopteryx taeniolatus]|uniref:transmembrane 9 superfamily member 1 n=1 Tax=Phyllopteryx taeniolatus TaxID=161469 RepID=UPI002AD1F08E|nr:transmembrane 9 superfamily member 1 [Phyllopteryx taeniolatus]XP_061614303.1 transmembrane 9 superfamily member 1 [Phyllopteryx taeniolatus]XP_061614304.1 transmembrane 9 superfamily member 1 [Phyllopteryx taeniolatus]XP_061614305.1 transmembrane 9 superfamily member 1 [Phyllopteryx taeniolatus]XP_061614306.1 transmembrane 9 superfamily member 1 [Phyllopteryx taeniolatus]